MGAKDNIRTSTPLAPAIPAISRLELVPMRVIEPARVVTCAIGSSTSRAGIPRLCSNCFDAGISIATMGVVFISAEPIPTGNISRASACWAVSTVARSLHVTRVTAPVWTIPMAITTIPATVITPLAGRGDAGQTRHGKARPQR